MGRDTITLVAEQSLQLLEAAYSPETVNLRVFVPRPILFTSELPGFADRLLNSLPRLWSTICKNYHGLPFAEELSATEMGHVFEHVMLALLTRHGVYAKGMTEWNWFDDPEGTFMIRLFGCELEPQIVNGVIDDAIRLVGSVLRSGELAAEVSAG